MTEEFNLSEKIIKDNWSRSKDEILVEDVKEFIRRLKQIFDIENSKTMSCFDICDEINRLAGSKLVEAEGK